MYSISQNTGKLSYLESSPVIKGAYPQNISIDASGQYAYVANTGNNTVSVFNIESNGALNLIQSIETGLTPFDITAFYMHKNKYAYVVNSNDNNTVSMYSIESNGQLNSLGTVGTGNAPRSIVIDQSNL